MKWLKRRINCSFSSLFFFLPPRDSGTPRSRPLVLRFPRNLTPDGLWRGSSQGTCSCPGFPADPPHRTNPKIAPCLVPHPTLHTTPNPAASNHPGAWGLWPAASPKSCELVMHVWSVIYLLPNLWTYLSDEIGSSNGHFKRGCRNNNLNNTRIVFTY